jgi:hypothetical protein
MKYKLVHRFPNPMGDQNPQEIKYCKLQQIAVPSGND